MERVPVERVMAKVNERMSHRDYAGVERVLTYWLKEAEALGDLPGQLTLRGELVGHYRKTGERAKAHESADAALELIRRLGFERTVSAATACINIATAYNSFGENAEALPLFEEARRILEAEPGADAARLGGLYNNMGLTLAALGRYQEAQALYDLAMARMAEVPGGALEQAVTCLNRCEALEAELGAVDAAERVDALLGEAAALIRLPGTPRDGYYAYVCETCAPAFDHYGWFADAAEMREEARRIYEGA